MKKFLTLLTVLITLLSAFSLVAFAETPDATDSEAAESCTFFDEAYEFISENADRILSALAFIGSLALAFAYRRGLIPLLRGGLGTLSGAVDSLKENTEAADSKAREILGCAAEKLDSAERLMAELTEKLSSIEKELQLTKEEERRAADLRVIMSTQIDLLHDIFMSSSLPYYRKEEVGERVAEMKRALTATEEE